MKFLLLSTYLVILASCTLPKKGCPDPDAVNFQEGSSNASLDACIYSPKVKFYSDTLSNGPVSIFYSELGEPFDSLGTIYNSSVSVTCDTQGLIVLSGDSYQTLYFLLTDSISSDSFNLTLPHKGCTLVNVADY